MLCVCVGDVMNVVFSVCIVRRGAVGARVWRMFVFMPVVVTVGGLWECLLCSGRC